MRFPPPFLRSEHNRAAGLMLGLSAVVAIWLAAFGELIFVENGLGFDGYHYVNTIMRRFPEAVFGEALSPYELGRSLPYGVLYYALRSVGLDLSDANVVGAFRALHALELLAFAVLWPAIARALAISPRGVWFGFVGVSVSFFVLKWMFYYPTLTDPSAFLIGLCMVYFYLARNFLGLALATLFGAFTWPTAIYQGVLLMLWPRPQSTLFAEGSAAPATGWSAPAAVASGLAGGILVYVVHHVAHAW